MSTISLEIQVHELIMLSALKETMQLPVGTDLAEPCYALLIFYSSAHGNTPLDNKLLKAGTCKAFSVFIKLYKCKKKLGFGPEK